MDTYCHDIEEILGRNFTLLKDATLEIVDHQKRNGYVYYIVHEQEIASGIIWKFLIIIHNELGEIAIMDSAMKPNDIYVLKEINNQLNGIHKPWRRHA